MTERANHVAHARRDLLRLEMLDRLVDRRVDRRKRLTKLNVGLLDCELRCQALLVDHFLCGREVEQVREQETAAIRQPHQTLSSKRALATKRHKGSFLCSVCAFL